MNWYYQDYRITTEQQQFNVNYVYQYLNEKSYWAKGIPQDVVSKAIQNSLCFAIFIHHQQIGFARVITDYATMAYLSDVFVDENYRGQGLSKWLMSVILAYPDLQGLRRFLLATRDAHRLYKKFGFAPLAEPELFMQIHNKDVYSK